MQSMRIVMVLALAAPAGSAVHAGAAATEDKAVEVIVAARTAMGGQKLEAVKAISATGEYRRMLGEREMDGEATVEILAPADVPLSSQLTLMRADERAGVVSSERIEERAAAGRRLVRHPLELRKLKPGLYRLEVTVTTGRGGLARRWKEFEVR